MGGLIHGNKLVATPSGNGFTVKWTQGSGESQSGYSYRQVLIEAG